jgi:3-methylcrotonyl-CoA carboxylase alpha subunit
LQVLRMPEGDGIRVETGVRQGDAVTPFYDPMIAKIIAWGEDRAMARSRLGRALAATGLFGVTTNLDFLRQVVADQEFAAGRIDTGFVERRRDVLLAPVDQPSDAALAAVTLYRLLSAPADLRADPWSRGDGWRLNLAPAAQTLTWRFADGEYEVAARAIGMNWELRVGEQAFDARGHMLDAGELAVTLDGVRRHWSVLQYGGTISVSDGQKSWIFEEIDRLAPPEHADIGGGLLTAPMPGRIIQLLVAAGEQVHRGQPLLVLEAMKMEHTIAAPRDGVVATVHYVAGDLVDEGAELIALAEIDGAAAER